MQIVYNDSTDLDIDGDPDDYCVNCKGYYYDKNGPKVDWICCVKCKKWLHETCTTSDTTCNKCS